MSEWLYVRLSKYVLSDSFVRGLSDVRSAPTTIFRDSTYLTDCALIDILRAADSGSECELPPGGVRPETEGMLWR